MGDNIKQHTLTKVLLERFARDGKLLVVLKTGAAHVSSPKTEARVRNYLTAHKELVEGMFHLVEGSLSPLFRALDEERLLSPEEQHTAKMAIALHLVRSKRTKDSFDKLANEQFTKTGERLKQNPEEFIEIWRNAYGRDPNPQEMDELMTTIDGATDEYIQKVKRDGTFDLFISDMYKKFQAFMEDAEVEVGVARGRRTLLLPDVGALIRDHEADKNGFTQGVSLTSADIIWLTFGPRHVVSIVRGKHKGKRPQYTELSDDHVKKMNEIMISDTEEKYYRALP